MRTTPRGAYFLPCPSGTQGHAGVAAVSTSFWMAFTIERTPVAVSTMSRCSCSTCSFISEAMYPGKSVVTAMSRPRRPTRSIRMPSARCAIPALVAAYDVIEPGIPRMADSEEMTTRWPALRS